MINASLGLEGRASWLANDLGDHDTHAAFFELVISRGRLPREIYE